MVFFCCRLSASRFDVEFLKDSDLHDMSTTMSLKSHLITLLSHSDA